MNSIFSNIYGNFSVGGNINIHIQQAQETGQNSTPKNKPFLEFDIAAKVHVNQEAESSLLESLSVVHAVTNIGSPGEISFLRDCVSDKGAKLADRIPATDSSVRFIGSEGVGPHLAGDYNLKLYTPLLLVSPIVVFNWNSEFNAAGKIFTLALNNYVIILFHFVPLLGSYNRTIEQTRERDRKAGRRHGAQVWALVRCAAQRNW